MASQIASPWGPLKYHPGRELGVPLAMNCQDAREHFSALLDASIGLTEWVPLEAHLRQCEACQHELEALRTSERPRPPLWRPNLTLDFVSKAFQGIRPADLMDRLRQRVFPSNRVMRRGRPRPDLFGKMLDVLRPADRTSPRRRRVNARRRITWRPKLGADLVRKALEATRRLDVVTRRHRIVPSLAPVARRALKTIRPLAVATWRRRRVFLHVKVRQLRLTATVILVALGAVGLFRYRAEVDIAIRHWVPSAPSSGEGPPPTKMASTEPATRPEIPPVSPPATPVPAPPALSPSPAPPAPQKPSEVTAPTEPKKGSAQPREPDTPRRAPAPSSTVRDARGNRPAKPEGSTSGQVEQPLQKSKSGGAKQTVVASAAPGKEKAGEAVAASTPPAAGDTRPSLDVVGRLRVKSRSGAERDLAALLAKAGGTTVSRQRGEKITVIEALVPNPSYGEFAEGLTRIGSWQIEAGRSRLPDPVRVTVRLVE